MILKHCAVQVVDFKKYYVLQLVVKFEDKTGPLRLYIQIATKKDLA